MTRTPSINFISCNFIYFYFLLFIVQRVDWLYTGFVIQRVILLPKIKVKVKDINVTSITKTQKNIKVLGQINQRNVITIIHRAIVDFHFL